MIEAMAIIAGLRPEWSGHNNQRQQCHSTSFCSSLMNRSRDGVEIHAILLEDLIGNQGVSRAPSRIWPHVEKKSDAILD
jgi:hypothetical protein